MTSGSITVRTEALDGSPLARAAIAGEAPPGWYEARPNSPAEWRRRVDAVHASFEGSGWLDQLWPAIDAHGAAAERLRRAAEHGVVVTTGQQPGLFGGPTFTWFKALTALALANALEEACGMPVAPVLWAATDDADFAEASITWIARPGGAVPLTLSNAPWRDGMVMAATPLGDVRPQIEELESAAGSSPYPEAIEAVRANYASTGDASTVGGAYVGLLRRLLEPLGVAVLDAAHHSVRAQAFPFLRRALEKCDTIEAELRARGREIEKAGYKPQVALVPGLSLVFEYDEAAGTKRRVPVTRAVSVSQRASAGRLMPNVLLRPIVERAVLPTVAYTAGPGEMAYFAQVSAVAATLESAQPLAVPRWAGTIVEPEVARLLDRYGLTIDDLRDPHAAENRFAREALPPTVRDALQALGESIGAGIAALSAADAAGLAPTAVGEGARRSMRHRLERLERRYVAGVKRANVTAMQDIATLRGWLFPHGVRQERALNFIPTLARHGPSAIDALTQRIDEHVATVLLGTTAGVGSISSAK